MQCEIRTMGETNARARSGRTSDTLPKPGRVTEGKVEISLYCQENVRYRYGCLNLSKMT